LRKTEEEPIRRSWQKAKLLEPIGPEPKKEVKPKQFEKQPTESKSSKKDFKAIPEEKELEQGKLSKTEKQWMKEQKKMAKFREEEEERGIKTFDDTDYAEHLAAPTYSSQWEYMNPQLEERSPPLHTASPYGLEKVPEFIHSATWQPDKS